MGYFRWKKYLALSVALFLIVINVIVDHFLAPAGLLLSPIILLVSVSLISFGRVKFNPILQCIIGFILIAINDAGIKIFGGGIHDSEGQGVLNLLFLVGVGLCFLVLAISVLNNVSISLSKRLLAISVFLILSFLYIYFFSDLGLNPVYL